MTDSNPETFIVKKEREEAIRKVLNDMPEIYRVVIEKFYFHDKPYETIQAIW